MSDDKHMHTPEETASTLETAEVSRNISEHPVTYFFRYVYEIVKTVIVVLVFALIIRTFLVQPFVVDGSSMEPTFHNHEYLMVEKLNFAFHSPQRGDIVVFKYPLNPSLNYVKRIIGVPGDRVVIAQGKVTVYNNLNPNGLALNEAYIPRDLQTKVSGELSEHTWSVDQNSYFVLGDNRDHSDDSRSWGLVPQPNIVGKVWLTVYPFEDFGVVHHAAY